MKLKSVTLPDSLVNISNQAFDLTYLQTNPVFPNGLQYIGELCFATCRFSSVTIPDSVIYMGDCPFGYNENLMSIYISSNNKNYLAINNSIVYTIDRTYLLQVLPHIDHINIDFRCRNIAPGCFSCSHCEIIIIPPNVESIPVRIFSYSYVKIIEITGNTKIDKISFYLAKNLTKLYYGGIKIQNQYNLVHELTCQYYVCPNYNSANFFKQSVEIDPKFPCFYPKCETIRENCILKFHLSSCAIPFCYISN